MQNEEEQYWFNLLSELGSQPSAGSGDAVSSELINEYQYLDVQIVAQQQEPVQEDNSIEPVVELVQTDFLGRSGMQNHHFQFEPTALQPAYEEEALSFSRIRTLKKYSDQAHVHESSKGIWEDHLPAAYAAIRSELVFETMDEPDGPPPLPPVQSQWDDIPLSVQSAPTPPAPEERMVVTAVSVPLEGQAVPSPSLPAIASQIVVSGAKLSGGVALTVLGSTSTQVMLLARIALERFLTYLHQHAYVQTVLGSLDEASSSLQELLDLSGLSSKEPHAERIASSQGWQAVFWRHSLASLSWSQRQMIEETKDIYSTDEAFIRGTLRTGKGDGEMEGMLANGAEDDIQFILAKYFTPPAKSTSSSCHICSKGLFLRHNCAYCGGAVCAAHSTGRRVIYRYGLTSPARVCDNCKMRIDRLHATDELIWKDRRVQAYLAGRLIPYTAHTPSGAPGLVDYSLLMARSALQLASPTRAFTETAEVLRRVGLTGFAANLIRPDIMDSIETLKKITGIDHMFASSLHEMTACIYHKLAVNRYQRGCLPGDVATPSGGTLEAASEGELATVIRYAPLACTVIYEEEVLDMQRMGGLQGLSLLFAHTTSSGVFAMRYALFATSLGTKSKEVVLALRADLPIVQLAELLSAAPVPVPPAQHILDLLSASTSQEAQGVPDLPASPQGCEVVPALLSAALGLLAEVGPALNTLGLAGYSITVLGHSTAGAVAALMSYLLHGFVHVRGISYGAPPCFTACAAEEVQGWDHVNVSLQDDIVSRLSKQSISALLRDMLVFREVFRSGNPNPIPLAAPLPVSPARSQSEDTVMVEPAPSPVMRLPGRLLHMSFVRGQHTLSSVPADHLKVINIQSNMFADHSNVNILNALLSVRACRRAAAAPPRSVPFHASGTCSCCHGSFTWHATFKGEPSEYRERYNCRHCGELVCGPCSTQRRCISKFGMIFPVRVCDRCVLLGDYAY